jgi:crotonobetainyl-CoA:carnitine CoA-transferase CaiB-like acyl-CoA transferase
VLEHEQLVARGVFRDDPSGTFRHPRPPYRIDDREAPPFGPAPRLGEHDGRIALRSRPVAAGAADAAAGEALPLAGLRVIDMTAWWAGPSATHMLAALGADVIHVESTTRPDGMRMIGGMLRGRHAAWWECSHFFLATNCNKRGLAVDLGDRRGIAVMERLVAASDVLVDNFTPRVLDGFGLGWERFHALNPQAILLRMPAFGLSGPWRDHTGFAQTMEQLSGLAWLTGHRDDQPRIQRGPCDPLAGMHAAFALLVALAEREQKGEGVHVECTMVEGALNAAAEAILEWSAYGGRMQRDGNRSPAAAPQGLYPCRGHTSETPRWLALSVASDDQWRALKRVLGRPGWSEDARLDTLAGRRDAHDAIDAALRGWLAERDRDASVEALVAAGIPAAVLRDPRRLRPHPQLAARGFFEEVTHPVVGRIPVPGLPFRYARTPRWIHDPAPTLGQHNREILAALGLAAPEIEALAREGVIGEGLAPGG